MLPTAFHSTVLPITLFIIQTDRPQYDYKYCMNKFNCMAHMQGTHYAYI